MFNAYLALGYYLKQFKELNTIILKKLQKLRYNILKAYRLIALLNKIGKVLEKLVARRISKAAKTYYLLPKE